MKSTQLRMEVRSQNSDDLRALAIIIREGWEVTSIEYQGVNGNIHTMMFNLIRHWECE